MTDVDSGCFGLVPAAAPGVLQNHEDENEAPVEEAGDAEIASSSSSSGSGPQSFAMVPQSPSGPSSSSAGVDRQALLVDNDSNKKFKSDPDTSVHEPFRKKPTREERSQARDSLIAAIEGEDDKAESSAMSYAEMTVQRSPESTVKSRKVEIDTWMSRGVVKDWPRWKALETGAKILTGRWVDDQHKDKSRYVAREFASKEDPMVFANASDHSTSRRVDLRAVRCGYPTWVFDVVSAFTHAPEEELIFLEPPQEHTDVFGDALWQPLRTIYGPRPAARRWQAHFCKVVTSSECKDEGFTVVQCPKSPNIYNMKEADGVVDLHVDDGHCTGIPEIMERFFAYVSTNVKMKISAAIVAGMKYEFFRATKVRTSEGLMTIPANKYIRDSLEILNMQTCNPSNNPKLEKIQEDGDDDPLEDDLISIYRTVTCRLIYLASERSDIQPTVQRLCKALKTPSCGDFRQLKKLMRYLKATEKYGAMFPEAGLADGIRGLSDSDWATDKTDGKSISGGVLMVGGCRLHSHGRAQPAPALKSGEAEIISSSELAKEALMMQHVLEHIGFGLLPIYIHVDSACCRSFVHRKGVGRMKHIDVRWLRLHSAIREGILNFRKIPRDEHCSDMLTQPPFSAELQKFCPQLGIFDSGGVGMDIDMVVAKVRAMTPSNRAGMVAMLGWIPTARAGAESDSSIDYFTKAMKLFAMIGFSVSLFLVVSSWMRCRRWCLRSSNDDSDAEDGPPEPDDPRTTKRQKIYFSDGGERYHLSESCYKLKHCRVQYRSCCLICEQADKKKSDSKSD